MKSKLTEARHKAQKMCTHRVVYTGNSDIMVAIRGMQGRSTKAIARELGISEAQAQYRVMKAQDVLGLKFRAEYRSGDGPLSKRMLQATERIGRSVVRRQVAPKFKPARP